MGPPKVEKSMHLQQPPSWWTSNRIAKRLQPRKP